MEEALCVLERSFRVKREVEPEEGWIPKARNRALGGGDPQEAGRGSLLGPVRKDKKAIGLADTSPQTIVRRQRSVTAPAKDASVRQRKMRQRASERCVTAQTKETRTVSVEKK